jgi:competence protein ComEA
MLHTITAVVLSCGLVCGFSSGASAQEPSSKAGAAGAASAAASALNLNTAKGAQTETLPGIGKATADRILEYRQKNGGFKKVEDLMNVRGVGEKSFLKLKPLVTVALTRAERAAQKPDAQ